MSQIVKEALQQAMRQQHLSHQQAEDVFRELMSGSTDNTLITALLAALAAKGEVADEVYGAARAMRDLSVKVPLANTEYVIDTCGTGGDGANTFNISTAAAIVAAAAGVKVAKHGNRAFSSKSGSADVLEEMRISINLTPEQIAQCIEQVGIGFIFAPHHHPAVKHVGPARKSLGARTIFNMLGPLTNPAGVRRQLTGAYSLESARVIAETLVKLDSQHALVVHSEDGLDEISAQAPTHAFEVRNGEMTELTINPQDYRHLLTGYKSLIDAPLDIKFFEKQENATVTSLAASQFYTDDPVNEITAMNAGAAIYISGTGCDTLDEGIAKAIETMRSPASDKIEREWQQFTWQFKEQGK